VEINRYAVEQLLMMLLKRYVAKALFINETMEIRNVVEMRHMLNVSSCAVKGQ
jgi:hypothetical protein